MAPRFSGQTPIFGVVFFVSKSLLGIEGERQLAILNRESRSHAKILSDVAYYRRPSPSHYSGETRKRRFIFAVRPTVHTNPTKHGGILKRRLFLQCGRNHFEHGAFCKR